jgi:hypothetical protein
MKAALITSAIMLALLPSAALAKADLQEEAVKAVVEAITHGEDLNARFPGALSAKDLPTLQLLSKCKPFNLMRQKKGDYTVVWVCGSKTELGMEVLLTDDRVASISTMEVFRRPSFGGH